MEWVWKQTYNSWQTPNTVTIEFEDDSPILNKILRKKVGNFNPHMEVLDRWTWEPDSFERPTVSVFSKELIE